MEWDEKLRTAVIHSKWEDTLITKFKDGHFLLHFKLSWVGIPENIKILYSFYPASEHQKLSFSSGLSRYSPKAARRFVFPFFAEVSAKLESLLTKRKGPWEGERPEVSPASFLLLAFFCAQIIIERDGSLGQEAALLAR